ncbi:unnamed protein product [Spirodela intermedia]|uniref:Uncharacterized protein n=1 Tax=Spirodela intermedia TaxID=51605 RepID=A0A7I8LP17_SPIIN|nr:unnamed protein product [Spirodela intermedia]
MILSKECYLIRGQTSVDHVKSGYLLGCSPSTSSGGGRTTLFIPGERKKAKDLRGVLLFTTALCRQLLYLPEGGYCEGIADVDDEGAGIGADGAPAALGEDLKAVDVVLVEDGEGGGVAVGACSEREMGVLAGGVVIQPHDGVVLLEQVPEGGLLQAQAHCQQLHYRQRELPHRLAVLLVQLPAEKWRAVN